MSDWQTVLQIREQAARKRAEEKPSPGPYVTISRQHLQKIYAMRFPRMPAVGLVCDDARFTHVQIAQHVAHMMKLKHFI